MTTEGIFTSGQGYRERSDSSSAVGGPSWVQPGFIAPTNVLATLTLAYDCDKRAARYQIEVQNPVTRELLALRSRPFHYDVTSQQALRQATTWLQGALDQLGVGDPF